MVIDLGSLVVGGLSGHSLTTFWNAIPEGVKHRCGQGIDRLTGKLTRRWDREDKKEDADVADDIKREDNKSEAQKKVLDLLVPDVAKAISADPVLMERATIEMMGDAYRKQENKDAVAEEALKDIGEKHTDNSSTNEPLDEDWLNMFSSYAEKASTERTRQLWGRILSGEVRHPGRFSLSTLRILSEIDQNTAQNLVEIAPLIDGGQIIVSTIYKNTIFNTFLSLQQSGIISGVDTMLSRPIPLQKDGSGDLITDTLYIKIKSPSGDELNIPAMSLTKTGNELLKIIDYKEDIKTKIERISGALEENALISEYEMFNITKKEKDRIQYNKNPIKCWKRTK